MSRRSRRGAKTPEPEPAPTPVDLSQDEPESPAPGSREARARKRAAEPEEEDKSGAANAGRRLKLFRDEETGKFTQDPEYGQTLAKVAPPEPAEGEKKDKETERAEALAPDELDALVSKMARYLLMRGTKKLPIIKSRLGEVLGDYKKMRITTYVFARAARLLYDAWGYEVTQAPPRCGDFEFKGQAKDSWYVVQAKKRRDPRHANLVATQLPSAELAQRGLLLAVLSVVQANSGTVTDTELYRRLHAMDPRVPDEPYPKSSSRNEVSGLGNVALLLEAFAAQQYIVRYKDSEDEEAISLGPRALVDVGRYQIAQFSSDALGHEVVDQAIIREIADSVRDPNADPAAADVAAASQ
mmetsp:Transcript_3977/g.11740  ORF Transcript_3977/g.11740 Transcript_3977/m.11740 type:complete len:355 (-) Transcript_3977:26-1090(-)